MAATGLVLILLAIQLLLQLSPTAADPGTPRPPVASFTHSAGGPASASALAQGPPADPADTNRSAAPALPAPQPQPPDGPPPAREPLIGSFSPSTAANAGTPAPNPASPQPPPIDWQSPRQPVRPAVAPRPANHANRPVPPDSPSAPGAPPPRAAGQPAPSAPLADAVNATANAVLAPRRSPDRANAPGITQPALNAIQAGLQWLAEHQRPDGLWSRSLFAMASERPPHGGQPTRRIGDQGDLGVSGLAILAFTADGHSPHAPGPYQALLVRAQNALLRAQATRVPYSGGFNRNQDKLWLYDDAIATLALAELCLIAHADAAPANHLEQIRSALQDACNFLLTAQQPQGGWDYAPTITNRNDTSITAWVALALAAAQRCQIRLPLEPLLRMDHHFTRATLPDGHVWYADGGTGVRITPVGAERRFGPAMLAAALNSRLLLGHRPDNPESLRQNALLIQRYPPSHLAITSNAADGLLDYYALYYAALATRQLGPKPFLDYYAPAREALLVLQRRGGPADGSWDPYGPGWGRWGRMGGRVYSTAICILTLQSPYRYPADLANDQAGHLYQPQAIEEHFVQQSPQMQREVARLGAALRPAIARPMLLRALRSAWPEVRLEAALALAAHNDPRARDELLAQLAGAGPILQQQIRNALRSIGP